MHDVMMDIEALSTQLGAVVLTIGAVIFDPESDQIGQTRILCNPWGYPDEGNERVYRVVETNATSKGDSYA